MTGPETPDALPVFTLLRSSDVGMAANCLATFRRNAREPFRHTILDDGSLTPADRDRLHSAIDPVTIVSRAEADDVVLPLLRDKPNCRRYRGEHAFALKLIDPPLLSGGRFALCDGDVLFLRPFDGFDRRRFGEDLVFMRDRTTAYSMSFVHRHWGRARRRMPEFVNAGVLYVGPGTFDLDFVEWFLGQDTYRKYVWVMEQTAWAAIGGRVRPFHFDPGQVAFPNAGPVTGDERVALHFISPVRYLLEDAAYLEALRRLAGPHAGTVATLRTEPAVFVDPIRDIGGRILRRLRPAR